MQREWPFVAARSLGCVIRPLGWTGSTAFRNSRYAGEAFFVEKVAGHNSAKRQS